MDFFKNWRLERTLPWLLIICGGIALVCAFVISVEKVHLLEHPGAVLPCDLNPVISCGSVMQSAQSHIFGFPNPFVGMMAFPIVIATGALLLANIRLPRWWWLGLQFGTIFGLTFVHWLFFQSTYRIGALCPYCIVVWIMTITIFWYVTLYNIQQGYVRLPASLQKAGNFVRRHHLDILLFWLLGIGALILHHFWYYYGDVLGF